MKTGAKLLSAVSSSRGCGTSVGMFSVPAHQYTLYLPHHQNYHILSFLPDIKEEG